MIVLNFFLLGKQRTIHLRSAVNINGRHTRGLETNFAAAVREFCFVCNVEMLTGKTINQRSPAVFLLSFSILIFCLQSSAFSLQPFPYSSAVRLSRISFLSNALFAASSLSWAE